MADWRPFLFVIFNIFTHSSKTNRDRDFVFVSKEGFLGMPNLVVMLPMKSESKWPTGGHFCSKFSTFLLITSKEIEIETSILFRRRSLWYAASSGDIPDNVWFKMADWRPFLFELFNIFTHNLKTNRDRDFVFVSKVGFWGMPHLVVIFPMTSDSKWPTGGHFCLKFLTFYS